MTKVAVVTPEVVSHQMAGPAIRAWNMAKTLAARGHVVRLLSTVSVATSDDDVDVRFADPTSMALERTWADVVVTHPGVLRTHPVLRDVDRPLVVDIYDPFHLENLEPGSASRDDRAANVTHLNSVINDALLRGDFFLCASERQRDFWLGSLTALGRVNTATYDADTNLRSLIDVAPFGVADSPPTGRGNVLRDVVPGIGADDYVLLWAGGVYNWLDPLTLVDAIDRARLRVPTVRLVFLGMSHPNPHIPEMRMATDLRERSDELGLTGTYVFFNDGWVPYEDRGQYLIEADVGVSTHLLHLETAFSFRTRVLDYLWAGLPVVLSEGDVFAAMAEKDGFGVAVPPGDTNSLADAIVDILSDEGRRQAYGAAAAAVSERFRWSEVLRPLIAFCDEPAIAADRAEQRARSGNKERPTHRRWRR